MLKIKVGIRCKECGRGAVSVEIERHMREDRGAAGAEEGEGEVWGRVWGGVWGGGVFVFWV